MGIRVNTGTVAKKAATELLSNKRGEALAYDVLAASQSDDANTAGMALTSEELQKFLESAAATAQAPAAVQAEGPAFAEPTPIAGEFRVNTFTTGSQEYSAVTALDGGGFLVTWASSDQDGSGYGIYGQRYTATGVASGSEFRINTFTTGEQAYATASALIGGGFVVTWSSFNQDGSGYGIYGQRYTAGGVTDGGEFRISTATGNNQIYSSVTTLNDGGFVVTWTSNFQDGSGDGIYGQRYTSAGVAAGVEFRVNTYTPDSQYFAAVAALDNGGFVVTWTSSSQDGSAEGVYAQRYTSAGVADGSEFRVNTFTSGTQAYSSVAGLDGGGFVVTWSDGIQDGSGFGIYGQRYTAAGVADGGEFRINTNTNSEQFFSSVTALNGGGFMVTWSSLSQDGDSWGIYGQRYTASGIADGGEFRVSETTVGDQFQDVVPLQGVTQLADGSLVATWFGNGIGDGAGVFARRFALGATNTAPAGTDATLTITEDTARVLTVADFGFTDTDGNALLSVGITTLPSAGIIRLNGAGVTAGTFVTAADINAGLLVYTPGSNGNGVGYSSFTFQVRDNGGSTDTDLSANTITFNVTAVNDAPVITNLQGDSVNMTEGVTSNQISIDAGLNAVVTDPDSGNFNSGSLTFAITGGLVASRDRLAIVGNGTVSLSSQNVGGVVSVNGFAIGTISAFNVGTNTQTVTFTSDDATAARVQQLIRAVQYVGDPEDPVSGTRTVTWTLNDGDGGAGSTTATSSIVVIGVNDAPTGTDRTLTINEDQPVALTIANFGFDNHATSTQTENQSLQAVIITTVPTAGALYIDTDGAGTGSTGTLVIAGQSVSAADITAGRLVYVPAANADGIGAAAFTFQVQDNGGTENGGVDTDVSANTLVFNITAANDAPVSSGFDTITFVEDNPNAVPLDTGFDQILVDVDSPNFDGGTLTVRVSGGHVPTEDRLTFLPGGTSSLTVSGNVISYQGVAFATFSPGGLGVTRTFTFNANATVEAVQTLMRNLAYRNDNQDNPSTAQRTIEYILTDGDGGSQTLTSLVNVTAVNDAPVLDLNAGTTGIDDTNSYLEGSSAAGIGANIAISDDGGTLVRATVTITDAIAGDALTVTLPLPAGITVDPASTATNLILVGNASTSAFATALGQVGYSSTSDDPTASGTDTTRSITVVVNDGVADSAPATMTMTVAAANDAPVVNMTPTPIGPAFDQLTLNTNNGWNISGFVQAENFTLNAARTLNVFNVFLLDTGSGTATFDGFSGTLSFRIYANDGTGQPGTVLFTGADLAPVAVVSGVNAFGRDIYQFAVNLGGIALPAGSYWIALHEGAWSSASDGSELFWMFSANDVTGNTHLSTDNETAPDGLYTQQTGGLAFSFSGPTEQVPYSLKGLVTVSDVDAGSGVMTATLSVGYGVINVAAGTSGATVDSGNGTGSVVVSGTLAQLNALLNTDGTSVVTFTANTDTPPANTSFSVSVNDNGNTGGGGAQTGMASQTIVITAINDAPVADLNGAGAGIDTTGSYTEGDSAISPITGIVLSDPDNANLTGATVRITTGFVAGDILRLSGGLSGTTASGITFSYNSGTGVLTLSGSASVANYQAALATLAFKSNSDDPGTARDITVVVNDGTSNSVAANITLTVSPVNDAPVADLNGAAAGIDTTASYTEGGAPVSPIAAIVLSDVDSANLAGATVTIATGFVAGDLLRLAGGFSGTTASGITFGYNNTTGVLTLSGVASVADYQAALATLSFKSNSDDPGTARDITVVVNDGTSNSVAAHIALTVSPINDAPVNIVPVGQTTTSGDSIVFSAANGNALSVSDPDSGSGMIRVRLSVEHGTLILASTVGLTVTGDGTGIVKITGTLSAINAALNGLTYQGDAGYEGTDALAITTNDTGNTGSGGPLTDTDSVAITVDPAVSQAALSDKMFADDQESNISAAFASNDNNGDGGLDSIFYPAGPGSALILGSSFLI